MSSTTWILPTRLISLPLLSVQSTKVSNLLNSRDPCVPPLNRCLKGLANLLWLINCMGFLQKWPSFVLIRADTYSGYRFLFPVYHALSIFIPGLTECLIYHHLFLTILLMTKIYFIALEVRHMSKGFTVIITNPISYKQLVL